MMVRGHVELALNPRLFSPGPLARLPPVGSGSSFLAVPQGPASCKPYRLCQNGAVLVTLGLQVALGLLSLPQLGSQLLGAEQGSAQSNTKVLPCCPRGQLWAPSPPGGGQPKGERWPWRRHVSS